MVKKFFFLVEKKGKERNRGGFWGNRLSFFLSPSLSLLLVAVAGGRELGRAFREVVLDRGVGDLFVFFFFLLKSSRFCFKRSSVGQKNLKKKTQTILTPCGP